MRTELDALASRSRDYGVLTPRRLLRWIGALVLTSTAIATALGFVGAAHGISFDHFNWSLAAVGGTAVGTVLLAGFTGALAWTTSGDVRATIRLADATQEDQRARNRPIVVVRLDDVREVVLDQNSRQTVGALQLWIKNVGLGPALDLRLRATYRGGSVPTEEVISVVAVDEEIDDRWISLAGVDEPEDGFTLSEFLVDGECTDRTRSERQPIVTLVDEGLPDQIRAAREAMNKRAWLELATGPHGEPKGKEIRYETQVPEQRPGGCDRRPPAARRRFRHGLRSPGHRRDDACPEPDTGHGHLPLSATASLCSADLARRNRPPQSPDRRRLPSLRSRAAGKL